MKTLAHYVFGIGVPVLLIGCNGSQPPIAPGAVPQSRAIAMQGQDGGRSASTRGREQTLFTFDGRDGAQPRSTLVNVNGVFYGTTWLYGKNGWGTVFSLSSSGTETVLHRFDGKGSDGRHPEAGVISVGGTLYGTTYGGGAYRSSGYACGTVFSVTSDGTEKVLHNFGCDGDGAHPAASLINVNGTLYGTTAYGGAYHGGTVFSMTTSGTEHVLYSFGASKTDGYQPRAGLIYIGGVLYGTTARGGSYDSFPRLGGTVFTVTTDGYEHVLHNFGNGDDGELPVAALTEINGVLYGTTTFGGAYGEGSGSQDQGYGAVYSITPSGDEQVLHSFGSGNDGVEPEAGLVALNGALYGTTTFGGSHNLGTLFSIGTSGIEKVEYSFRDRRSGVLPQAGLVALNGALFGTTSTGGRRSGQGAGTVFEFTP